MLDHHQVAIIDYGMGNLFSVKLACEGIGLQAKITSSWQEALAASAVILPGVGAFGSAIAALRMLDLVEPLKDVAASQTPLLGICLGTQLLMSESHEFGQHQGLGLIEGEVVRLEEALDTQPRLKVPQVGWNQIRKVKQAGSSNGTTACQDSWQNSLLDGLTDGEFMYFVHSFYCKPVEPDVVLSTTRYGAVEFCSSLRQGNVFGFQFHPERSGRQGLHIYRNLAAFITRSISEASDVREVGSQIRST